MTQISIGWAAICVVCVIYLGFCLEYGIKCWLDIRDRARRRSRQEAKSEVETKAKDLL